MSAGLTFRYSWSSHTWTCRVSQQVWNNVLKLRIVCKRIVKSLRKNVFCSKKLLFEHFLWTAKLEKRHWSNFSWSDLFSKLEKIRTFYFAAFKKMLKKQFFGAKYKFFCKCSLLGSQTFLSFWAIPNMLGHPVNKNMFCTNFKMRFDSLLKNVFHFNYIIPGNLFCLFFCWQKRERDCFECKRELLLLLKSFHAKWILLWRRCSCMSFILLLLVYERVRDVV